MMRLNAIDAVKGAASLPGYDPARHGCGIVHIGVGAFHRAHQAVYTDQALAASGGDWRILGVSLRGTDVGDAINPQSGLYTLIERSAQGTRGRVIASIDHVIAASREPGPALSAMCTPDIRIVSLTVTEKAYGLDRIAMTADPSHAAVVADLADPRHPKGVLGLLVEALRLRRLSGIAPFTVLCCDNLPENGSLLRAGACDFARRVDPGLAEWIEAEVAFPSSMVDRITPAATQATLDEARHLTGCLDLAAVETEAFHQWVIEDHFTSGRPDWEKAGALFVKDVKPYELMKLRMLNGAHSMLAYAGFLSGYKYVRDVMTDPALAALVDRHMRSARKTLPELPGIDLETYRYDLLERFRNPAIAHETYQIAMDGTEKLPQRILAPAVETLERGGDIGPFAFAIAAWMAYCIGKTNDGVTYELRDPRQVEISTGIDDCAGAKQISDALHNMPGLIDKRLAEDARWLSQVAGILETILSKGMRQAVEMEVANERESGF